MTRDLVILGCGGFGREVADVVKAVNLSSSSSMEPWNLIGFLDDSPSAEDVDRVGLFGVRVLGRVDSADEIDAGTHYVVGIAAPRARMSVVERVEGTGLSPATLVHPASRIGTAVYIGD